MQREKEEKEEFIHPDMSGIKTSQNRKRFRNRMIPINLLKLPSSQGIVGEKSFVASRRCIFPVLSRGTSVTLTELSAAMLYIIITTLLGNVADGVFAVL